VITDSQAPAGDISQLRLMGIAVTLVEPVQESVALRQAFIPGIKGMNSTFTLRADSSDANLITA
jgi:hypothetical protein